MLAATPLLSTSRTAMWSVLTISRGKFGDNLSLIAQVGVELKMQSVVLYEHRWSALYTSALGPWRLEQGYRVFEEYCEA